MTFLQFKVKICSRVKYIETYLPVNLEEKHALTVWLPLLRQLKEKSQNLHNNRSLTKNFYFETTYIAYYGYIAFRFEIFKSVRWGQKAVWVTALVSQNTVSDMWQPQTQENLELIRNSHTDSRWPFLTTKENLLYCFQNSPIVHEHTDSVWQCSI